MDPDAAEAWLDQRLADAGVRRTGPVENTHPRPWAITRRVPTDSGTVWLKVAGRATGFEAGLYDVMHRVAPDHVLAPIATDAERAWMILPDGGPVLGDVLEGDELAEAMGHALRRYGELQRLLAPHADDLVAAGCLDMRPAMLPERFEQALPLAHDEDRARLEAIRPDVARWCEELAASPVAPSIDHNDLHTDNVFVGPPPCAYDWGDSVLAHPFASMLVAVRWMKDDEPRLRDAYLEAFTDLAPRAELERTVDLATRLALIAHALTWDRVLAAIPEGQMPEDWTSMPPTFLRSLLD